MVRSDGSRLFQTFGQLTANVRRCFDIRLFDEAAQEVNTSDNSGTLHPN